MKQVFDDDASRRLADEGIERSNYNISAGVDAAFRFEIKNACRFRKYFTCDYVVWCVQQNHPDIDLPKNLSGTGGIYRKLSRLGWMAPTNVGVRSHREKQHSLFRQVWKSLQYSGDDKRSLGEWVDWALKTKKPR